MPSLLEQAFEASIGELNNLSSEQYFARLVAVLSDLIGADYAFVCELSEDGSAAQTVSLWAKGQIADNFSYSLDGTPCQDLTRLDICNFPKDVPKLYPRDQMLVDMHIEGYMGTSLKDGKGRVMGLLVALYEQPIPDPDSYAKVFRVFEQRASAELGRLRYETTLNDQIEKLTEQNDQLRVAQLVYEMSADGIIVTDEDNRIRYVNRKIETMSGYNKEELLGHTPKKLSSGLHSKMFYQSVWNALQGRGHWQGELINRHKDGSTYPIFTSITCVKNQGDSRVRHIAIHRDVTKEKEAQNLIAYQASHDLLSGLYNRQTFDNLVDTRIKGGYCRQKNGVFVLLDVDGFKELNDTLGHQNGDCIIREIARRLPLIEHGELDLLGRMAGDEFAIFFRADSEEEVRKTVDSIQASFRSPIPLKEGGHCSISCSIGVSLYPEHATDADALYSSAELALRHAKEECRGSFVLLNPTILEQARRTQLVTSRLKLAIERKDIEPFFQPIVDIHTGAISHCEVLARWHDEVLGSVTPTEFIEVAEFNGLMPALGTIMAEKAISYMAALNRELNCRMGLAINRSPQEFSQDSELALKNFAHTHNFPLELLGIELTETLMIKNPAKASTHLRSLRKQGFHIFMDDFGTGYSSLAYLKNLPFHTLKIDRMFINDLCTRDDAFVLVKTIIEMAHNFDMTVVAEGVEDEEQMEMLKILNCDYVQGFLICRPLAIKDLRVYLAEKNLLLDRVG